MGARLCARLCACTRTRTQWATAVAPGACVAHASPHRQRKATLGFHPGAAGKGRTDGEV